MKLLLNIFLGDRALECEIYIYIYIFVAFVTSLFGFRFDAYNESTAETKRYGRGSRLQLFRCQIYVTLFYVSAVERE
jgi:hypothetical protein